MFRSSLKTLESARRDLDHGDYNWACFKAHQAAEKALKAILWSLGKPRGGHSLISLLNYLLEVLGVDAPGRIREICLRLDKHYIPTRYPDAWSEGAPEDYYSRSEAEEAIALAYEVIGWVEGVWRELLRRGGELERRL